MTIYDLAEAWWRGDSDTAPESDYFPDDTTADEVQEQNVELMNESQVVAAATALRALGKPVPTTVAVADVPDGSPASGVLEKGDVLRSVDGTDASDPDAVRAAVREHRPGRRSRSSSSGTASRSA